MRIAKLRGALLDRWKLGIYAHEKLGVCNRGICKTSGCILLCGCGVRVGCSFCMFFAFSLFGIRAFWGLLSERRNSNKWII
nr:MAG TPA: hypothetical protein [Caudoviricetes sp.]